MEVAECRGRLGEAPRRVERPARRQAPDEGPTSREHVDESIASTGDVIVLGRVLLGVSHVDPAADVLDPERRKAGGKRAVDKGAGPQRLLVKLPVEHIDRAEPEVARVQVVGPAEGSVRQPLVDRAHVARTISGGRPVDGDHRGGRLDGRVPAEDGAVLGREQEPAGR